MENKSIEISKHIRTSVSRALIEVTGGQILDENNIVWRNVNGEFIGKRSVWTFDNRGCWLEHTTIDNVKTWWCGKDADYTEIFKK